ncbi:hypothetical protein LH399_13870 [Fusobacterium nucleatum]
MKNLKTITTDEFLEKFDNDTLEDEDLRAIYFQRTFEDTENSYWEEVEKGEYYRRLYFTKAFKKWEIVKIEGKDKSYAVIGTNKYFTDVFEIEEKGNMLIIDKDKQYGFNPDYISERSYRSFEDIKVVKYIYE